MTTLVTPAGYQAPTVDEVVQDLNAKILANVDAGLDLDPDQPMGQVIGIFAEKVAEIYELAQTVYDAIDPAGAEGQLLANLATITGTIPQVATYSTVSANLSLNAGITVHAGAIVAVTNQPSNTWVATADIINSGGSPAVVAGLFRSSQPGQFAANAGTLTVINTPTIGWTAVTNPSDATLGINADTDTTLRQRRAVELQGQGSGDCDAIRTAVMKSDPNVTTAFCYENTGMFPDANGVPGKAFHVVIDEQGSPASNAAVAQAIWNSKPSGIQSYGGVAVQVTDAAGNPQNICFDRALQLPLYVACTTTPGTLTTAGTLAVKAALAAWALANLGLGVSVIAVPFRAAALVPGVTTDVPTFKFDIVPSPTNTANLAASVLEVYTLSTSNITVNGL